MQQSDPVTVPTVEDPNPHPVRHSRWTVKLNSDPSARPCLTLDPAHVRPAHVPHSALGRLSRQRLVDNLPKELQPLATRGSQWMQCIDQDFVTELLRCVGTSRVDKSGENEGQLRRNYCVELQRTPNTSSRVHPSATTVPGWPVHPPLSSFRVQNSNEVCSHVQSSSRNSIKIHGPGSSCGAPGTRAHCGPNRSWPATATAMWRRE